MRGCRVSQNTAITDHSSGDHATEAETMESKSRESGLSGSDSGEREDPGREQRWGPEGKALEARSEESAPVMKHNSGGGCQ